MFYRYIYCEIADVTVDSVLPLMYAAKKYLLTSLVTQILTDLEKLLSTDNVCGLLERSMSILGESEFKDKCLEFICRNADRVFSKEEFLHLSHDTLDEIVSLDYLAISNERLVYENCVEWARLQLLGSGNESPSDEEIRDKLGSVLYKIRFPTMTQKDFAELTAHSSVLTAEEKCDVYVCMALRKSPETLKFVAERRRRNRPKGFVLDRFSSVNGNWNCYGYKHAIRIQTTEDIYLTGVGLFGGQQASTHDVGLVVLEADRNTTLSKTNTRITSDGMHFPIKVEFRNPVYIRANVMYILVAVIKGPRTWAGKEGKASYQLSESGRISFYEARVSENVSEVSRGQIPQLFYSLIIGGSRDDLNSDEDSSQSTR